MNSNLLFLALAVLVVVALFVWARVGLGSSSPSTPGISCSGDPVDISKAEGVLLLSPPWSGAAYDSVQKIYAASGADTSSGQFGTQRNLILLAPGTYENASIPVSYYTQVAGMGSSKAGVVLSGGDGVYSRGLANQSGLLKNYRQATSVFWKSMENLTMQDTVGPDGSGPLWATSQACPLRSISVKGSKPLMLAEDGGFTSGGFMADCDVSSVETSTQQQFCFRNSELSISHGCPYFTVFLNCTGALDSDCSKGIVSWGDWPAMPPKPLLQQTDSGASVAWNGSLYPIWSSPGQHVPSCFVWIDRNASTPGALATAALADPRVKGVVFAPGIYNLEAPVKLTAPGRILLGLGFATLVSPSDGLQSAIVVSDEATDAVLCGLILEASSGPSSTAFEDLPDLCSFGSTDHGGPGGGYIYDVFARVGGPKANVRAGTMLRVRADAVTLDNLWLWVADHDVNGRDGRSQSSTTLVVSGDRVIATAVACEHCTEGPNLRWSGKNGLLGFFQSEINYVFGNESPSYQVDSTAEGHRCGGLGGYSVYANAQSVVSLCVAKFDTEDATWASVVAAPFSSQLPAFKNVVLQKGKSPFGGPVYHTEWACPLPTS